jgi:precorrin-6A/cobalt-precorrin-6A reductase
VFFSAGQLTAEFVEQLAAQNPGGEQRQVLRSANRSDFPLPDTMTWIEAIGPFDRDGERALFERFSFDALVSKNSGGPATAAKLDVARERGVPVFMLRRPDLPAADAEFADAGDCSGFVSSQLAEKA